MTTRGYTVSVDWDNDGTHVGTYDDVTTRVMAGAPIEVGYGRNDRAVFGPAPAAKLSFALRNNDNQFTPGNAAGPLYGKIRQGRRVRMTATADRAWDTFTRTTSSSWGTSTSGHVWSLSGGLASEYSTNGTQGVMSLASAGTARTASLPTIRSDGTVVIGITVPAVAAGAPIEFGVYQRWGSATSYYLATVRFETDQSVTCVLSKEAGAGIVALAVGAPAGMTYTAGSTFWIEFQTEGSVLRMRTWPTAATKPADWQITASDTSLTSGIIRLRANRNTGNTNGTVNAIFDNMDTIGPVMFEGVIDTLSLDTANVARTLTVECLDAGPGAERISTPLYAGVRTGDAISAILDQAGWPATSRAIDPGASVLPWWWAEGEDASAAIEKVLRSEGPPAAAYVEGGIFTFRDRHHRILSPRSTVSAASYVAPVPPATLPGGAFQIIDPTSFDDGLAGIVNTVEFTVDSRKVGPFDEVWSADDTFSILDGQTILIEATASEPFFGAIVPVAGTDFVLRSGAVTVTLSRTSGLSVTIFVKATGGPATIDTMRLRGYPVPVARQFRVIQENQTSINTHGRRAYEQDSGWATLYDAQAIAQIIVADYADPRPRITVTLTSAAGATYLRELLDRRISDRLTVTRATYGISGDFYIERIDHAVTKLSRHDLTLGLQQIGPAQPSNVFRFDSAPAGFDNGVFAFLGISDPTTIFVFDDAARGIFDTGVFAN